MAKDICHVPSLQQGRQIRDRQLTFQLRSLLADISARIEKELDLLVSARGRIAGVLYQSSKCPDCQARDCTPCAKLRDLRALGLGPATER